MPRSESPMLDSAVATGATYQRPSTSTVEIAGSVRSSGLIRPNIRMDGAVPATSQNLVDPSDCVSAPGYTDSWSIELVLGSYVVQPSRCSTLTVSGESSSRGN